MLDAIFQLFVQGGLVTYVLALVSVALWTAVWIRARVLAHGVRLDMWQFVALCREQPSSLAGQKGIVAHFVDDALRLAQQGELQRLGALKRRALVRLATMRSPIQTLVAVAPLLGLLGTVGGMVELFASLHGGDENTVAGGISTALITTQLGLVISAPGLVAERLLERRQLRLQSQIDAAMRVIASLERAP